MANIGSNRSPSPLSSRNFRNSETNSTTRRSFNGNPFARPNSPINPKSLNTPSPSNTADYMKRNLLVRKSTGSSSMFQEGKENHKDMNVIRSPATKGGSKNFMAPTISAASKFTPSPRKKILGEKNDVTKMSIQFFDRESDLKAKSVTFDDDVAVEQKETVLEVTFNSTNDSTEMLSDVTENSDLVKIMPFCCSPITSPIIAPLDSDPHLPPYDPKKNFLSPRPQYLRYKPNPRIELLLNKEGNDDNYGEEDVTRLEDSFNLSDNSSDTEAEVQEQETEAELSDSVHWSSEILSEVVSEEKDFDSEVKITSKARFFTRSKTVSFLFLMFLVACFSVSFTDLPPMDLPIYQDIGFSEIYHESLKFAGFSKESFDDLVENVKSWSADLVENVKNWSADFISYLSAQKSQLFSTHKISSIQFFNLTTHIQEEFVFNRNIGTDYIHDLNEETLEFDEMQEFHDDIDVEDGVVIDDIDVEDEVMIEEINEVQPDERIKSDDDGFVETKEILEDGPVIPETEMNDLEIEAHDDSETLSSLLAKSISTICLASFLMVIMAASAIFYMKKRRSNITTKTAKIRATDGDDDTCIESCFAESSSVEKGYKKKSINNKRESLASSSSDFSMSCSPSYGSFTTFERIPIKHKDEVMLTPIRRSSRLLKT